jgi:hypothetical protein
MQLLFSFVDVPSTWYLPILVSYGRMYNILHNAYTELSTFRTSPPYICTSVNIIYMYMQFYHTGDLINMIESNSAFLAALCSEKS